MAQLSVLQIGAEDWSNQIETAEIDWHYSSSIDLPVLLAQQADPSFLAYTYVVLTDLVINSNLLAQLVTEWPAYRVVYLGQASNFNQNLQEALEKRGAFHFDETTPGAVSHRLLLDLYIGQVGFPTRFSETQFIPEIQADWHFKRTGRFSTEVTGDFGEEFRQIGTLKTFPGDYQPGQENLIYCDYQAEGSAELALNFVFFQNGRLQQMQVLQKPDVKRLSTIKAPATYQDYQILVLAKGQGKLNLHNVHQRRSRHGLGYFLPAGDRDLTTDGQEVLSYFNPGTKSGPLVVMFAGSRLHIEGFEMMGPLDELGYPYLLFADARGQGGAFMVGNDEYETLVMQKIKAAQDQLNLTKYESIFAGYSMGSYPAMYYAGKMGVNHLILAKPIIQLGTFTEQGDFAHQGINRDWPLDTRYIFTGHLDKSETAVLDKKLWQSLDQVNWQDSELSLFTMDQDDYDGRSLPLLTQYLKQHQVDYHHESLPGLHEEQIDQMVYFLKNEIVKQAKIINQEGWR
ncbi:accessory Sec system protein Asp2 [Fructobacillus ficulneus]|uniref:Accessory secretory protein Asp2 n=1 Tax=Fructobacillus ficulneus TaxID=157463 RepID=A0A0K8MI40_9LACO|nr:accessory Sec system protein Asp2 [Fructobacillus ficulneus]GAP00113.1 accessory secretory protein Asp2 [Fructobacillus ficulneus]